MRRSPLTVIRYGFDSVFDPERVVATRTGLYAKTRREQVRQATRLTVFYFINLFLYAIPLTLAGFGATGTPDETPAVVSTVAETVGVEPTVAWQYTLALVQNCSFLILASILTFLMFHVGVWLTRTSNGILQSMHTVAYSTGVYLATIFGITWFLSTSAAIQAADDWLIWLQAEFIYTIIDGAGAELELPSGRPDPVPFAALEQPDILALAGLLIAVLYYLYSLYLGARINHQSSRSVALLAVGFVVVSPVLFVVGSILTTVVLDGTVLTVHP